MSEHFKSTMLPQISEAEISDEEVRMVIDRCYVEVPQPFYQKRLADRLHCTLDIDDEGHVRGFKKKKLLKPSSHEPQDHDASPTLEHEDSSFNEPTSVNNDYDDYPLRDLNATLDDDMYSVTSDVDKLSDYEDEEKDFSDDISSIESNELPVASEAEQPVAMEKSSEKEEDEVERPVSAPKTIKHAAVLPPSMSISSEDEEEALLIQQMIETLNEEDLPEKEKLEKFQVPLTMRMKLILKRAFPPLQFFDGIPEYVQRKIPDVPRHLDSVVSGAYNPMDRKRKK